MRPGIAMARVFLVVFCWGAGHAVVAGLAKDDPAWNVYQMQFSAAGSGVYQAGDFVYAVTIQNDATGEDELRDVRARMDCLRLIREYAEKTIPAPLAVVTDNPLFQRRPDLRRALVRMTPELSGTLSLQGISVRILESRNVRGMYRFCMVFPTGDFTRCITAYRQQTVIVPSIGETISRLKKIQGAIDTSSDHNGLVGLYYDLGVLELAVAYAGCDACAETGIASFPIKTVAANTPEAVAYDNAVTSLREPTGHPLSELAAMNRQFPGFRLATERTANYYQRHDMILRALACYWGCLVNDVDADAVFQKVAECLQTMVKKIECRDIVDEYQSLVKQYAPLRGQVPLKSDTALPVVRLAWESLGHARFIHDEEPAQAPEAFNRAMNLFRSGGDWSEALGLLANAVSVAPLHADSWNLIGRVLMLQDKPLEAVPFLNQALTLQPEHGFARANLALCYKGLFLPRLSESMALAACMSKDISPKDWERMMSILESRGNKTPK